MAKPEKAKKEEEIDKMGCCMRVEHRYFRKWFIYKYSKTFYENQVMMDLAFKEGKKNLNKYIRETSTSNFKASDELNK